MSDYKVNILYMYPDLLDMYSDIGNLKCLIKRLEWRGIDCEVTQCKIDSETIDFTNVDLIFLGGGSDREQQIVSNEMLKYRQELIDYVENDGSILAICGGYQLLGKYYQAGGKKIEGVGILDIYTESENEAHRLTGDILIHSDIIDYTVVGFENHGGRTYIGDLKPLGHVLYGYGNNETSKNEGVVYKNLIGSYLHGPLLSKNPKLCDYILTQILKKKYPAFDKLSELDDTVENAAHHYMVNRLTGQKNKIGD